ncbi:MAG: glycosyltransferase family 4 protein [Myxococcota bacterium]
MKILFVTQVDLDAPHGGARHVQAVCGALAKAGHTVRLLARGGGAIPGVGRPQVPKVPAGARLEAVLAALIAKEAVFHRPDVAYVRISASTSATVAALSLARIPVVLELNGPILEELSRRQRSPQAIALARASLQAAVWQARSVVAASENVGRHAREALAATQVEVVLNGVDLEIALPEDRASARRFFELPEGPRFLVLVGTLVQELRLDLLAEAHRKLPGVGLLIVGDGPQAAFVDAMSVAARPSSPVLFTGAVPHPVAIRAIAASDVALNVRDGDLGMKGLEYAAVGRRQVAFEMPGSARLEGLYPPELEAVHLVKERSVPALRAAIVAALAAEERQGPLPKPAIDAARAQLGWEHKAQALIAILERAGRR